MNKKFAIIIMSRLFSALFFILFPMQKNAIADFCDERTTEAYHSPLCDSWVVQDPNRVDNVQIFHDPPYHTYSKWIINEQNYIFAYRDIDYDPNDLVADIYFAENGPHIPPIGIIEIPGQVINVLKVKLTSKTLHDIAIRFDAGKLQFISVVKFTNGKAKEVFQYGATEIEIKETPIPIIYAKARTSNTIEVFSWNVTSNKFLKIKVIPW